MFVGNLFQYTSNWYSIESRRQECHNFIYFWFQFHQASNLVDAHLLLNDKCHFLRLFLWNLVLLPNFFLFTGGGGIYYARVIFMSLFIHKVIIFHKSKDKNKYGKRVVANVINELKSNTHTVTSWKKYIYSKSIME